VSPRLPFLVAVGLVGGALVAASAEGDRPTFAAVPRPIPGLAAPVAGADDAVASTWYCAGGTAQDQGAADHKVVVANPTGHEVTGLLTVYPGQLQAEATTTTTSVGDTEPLEQSITVPPHGRAAFRLAELRSAPLASALVELDRGGVAVEHQVSGPQGRDLAPCASSAASTWHFAWGSTSRDARELLVLFNPFASDVTVDATFATEAGVREPLRWQGLNVPARSVVGVEVGEDVTRRQEVAATVRTRGGGRLVVDRVQILDGTIGPAGLSVALGQPASVETSLFAHGRVDDDIGERIALYNPGDEAAEVEVAVRGNGVDPQPPQPFGVVVRPGGIEIVDYAAEDRVPRGADHATVVRSRNGVPIVAERVLSGQGELSVSPGALFQATRWAFPVSDADAERAVQFAVVNPDPDRPARVSLDLYVDGDRRQLGELQELEVPAGGRITAGLPTAGGPLGHVSVVARSDAPVVVERMVVEGTAAVAVGSGIPMGEAVAPLPLS
jgi:hypothetical protein